MTDTTRHHVPRTMAPIHAVGKLIVTYLTDMEGSKASTKHRSIDLTASRVLLLLLHNSHFFPHDLAHRLST
jgi:hypothetical protein